MPIAKPCRLNCQSTVSTSRPACRSLEPLQLIFPQRQSKNSPITVRQDTSHLIGRFNPSDIFRRPRVSLPCSVRMVILDLTAVALESQSSTQAFPTHITPS